MNLKHLNDETLLKDLRQFAKQERALLTQTLYHHKELDSRRLYSSLGYKSLYEYACNELKYSADQAYRRIQAMRLLKEIPELSVKIDSGALSLSNISQAQRFFNESKSNNNNLDQKTKIQVLKTLEHKSVREAKIKILEMSPKIQLPSETKKQITPTQVQVNFLMSKALEEKLEDVRSLLGPKGFCNLAELVDFMADLSIAKLKEKRFGKKRMNQESNIQNTTPKISKVVNEATSQNLNSSNSSKNLDVKILNGFSNHKNKTTFTLKTSRYISAQTKHKVWQKDCGQCVKCKSKRNLNFDHIKPLALGGDGDISNLRLLCFSCNQRQKIEARL